MSDFERSLQDAIKESFLAQADVDVVDGLLARTRVWAFPAGRDFLNEGTPKRCGLIVSGLARVFAVKGDGGHTTIRLVQRGAVVGIRAMVGESNSLHVRAVTEIEFVELDPKVVMAAAQSHASLAWAIALEIGRRMRDTEGVLEAAFNRSVGQRVASALLDLLVESDNRGVAVSHEGLAEIVGASRESVGRALRRLDSRGAIALARRRIAVLDAAHLQTEAVFQKHASDSRR